MSVTPYSFVTAAILFPALCFFSYGEADYSSRTNVLTNDRIKFFEINCTGGCGDTSHTLSEIAENSSDSQTNVIIHIHVEKLLLSHSGHFRNLTSVILYGNSHALVCGKDQGLTFMFVGQVIIRNLKIKNCGSLSPLSGEDTQYISAVHILCCGQIVLLNVTVTQSSGVNIYRPTDNVTITDSFFTNNELPDLNHFEPMPQGGNGLRLTIFDKTEDNSSQYLLIERCHFVRNSDNGRDYSFLYGNLDGGRGRGGGMFILIDTTLQKIVLNISCCIFEENDAYLGAGLSLSLSGRGTIKNVVEISLTNFTRNGCSTSSRLGVGGGAFVSFENHKDYYQNLNEIYFKDVLIEMNCAKLGGGLFFFSNKYETNITGHLAFQNCSWTKNTAHIGSALMLSPNVFIVRAIIGHLTVPHFSNCIFQENSIDTSSHCNIKSWHNKVGSGTIYSNLFSMRIFDKIQFISNLGSGITILNGEINLKNCNAIFFNNTAVQGGALALLGLSTIVIGANKTYEFENNSAYDKGGAIFVQMVDTTEIMTSRSCFIIYREPSKHPLWSSLWNSSLIFRNNDAKRAGHSIFATSLLPCQLVQKDGSNYPETLNISEIFQKPGIVIESGSLEQQISTEGTEFGDNIKHLVTAPGLQQELDISILDDLGQPVDTNIVAILPRTSRLKVTSTFSNGSQYKIKLNGHEGENDTLTLQTLGTIQLRYELNVSLKKCPLGFRLNDKLSCECDFESYVGITKCENNAAYLVGGYWAGRITTDDNREILATSACPVGFCKSISSNFSSRDVRLPASFEELGEVICDISRRGILCGTCNYGYTVYYHSPQLSCKEDGHFSCKYGWFFYILSEIIPVTFVFGVVLTFNINLTSSSLNGFILFSQLQRTLYIGASGIIALDPVTEQLITVYQVIYGFFNLDFFNIEPLAYCLWKNASSLDMIIFKYITVLYSFFLMMSVIFYMRYCAAHCLGRYYSVSVLRNSIIHGLSGFLVLCYTQTITVSFNLLITHQLLLPSNEKFSVSDITRLWFSGDHKNFGKRHLPYAIPAVAALISVGCIPPILLLCYPNLNKTLTYLKLNNVWGLRSFEYLNKLKPLFDSFQGSFKDNCRFFAGLYFFYRWIGLVPYTLWFSYSGFYMTIQVTVVAILVLHSICQPYQKWQHNALDTFIFAIILIINGFTNLNYHLVRIDSGINSSSTQIVALQLFFIYLPIVYIVIHIMTCALKRVHCGTEPPLQISIILTKLKKKINLSTFSASKEAEETELPYRLFELTDDQ